MAVVWTLSGLADVTRIVDHLSIDSPAIARRIGQDLVRAADSRNLFPGRGRHGRLHGTRELWATGPYVLVYEVAKDSGSVTILRVWHAAQDRSDST